MYCVFTTQRQLFFCYHLYTLYPLLPPSSPFPLVITRTLSVSMVFFFLILSPSSPSPTPLPSDSCQSILSISVAVCILFICLICSLDSTYNWNHMVFVFLWVAYFTEHNTHQAHHAAAKGMIPFLFYDWVIFHCEELLFVYSKYSIFG